MQSFEGSYAHMAFNGIEESRFSSNLEGLWKEWKGQSLQKCLLWRYFPRQCNLRGVFKVLIYECLADVQNHLSKRFYLIARCVIYDIVIIILVLIWSSDERWGLLSQNEIQISRYKYLWMR